MYTAAYSLELWQLPQPKKFFQPLQPACHKKRNHLVPRQLTASNSGSLRNQGNSSSLCTGLSYRKESFSTQQLTASSCGSFRIQGNSSSLRTSFSFKNKSSCTKAPYSLQLWQLAQPRELFQPLHQLLLQKESLVRQLSASSCGSLHNQ